MFFAALLFPIVAPLVWATQLNEPGDSARLFRAAFPTALRSLGQSFDDEDAYMPRIVRDVMIFLVVFAFVASVASAQPTDPIVGTWKLNLAKSQYPIPAPKSTTVTIAPAAKGWTLTVDAVGPDGQPQKLGYTSTFDGSESPVTGNPNIDTAVFKSTETGGMVHDKKAGKVITTTSSIVSDDGKTMTVTVKVPDAQGEASTIVSVHSTGSNSP